MFVHYQICIQISPGLFGTKHHFKHGSSSSLVPLFCSFSPPLLFLLSLEKSPRTLLPFPPSFPFPPFFSFSFLSLLFFSRSLFLLAPPLYIFGSLPSQEFSLPHLMLPTSFSFLPIQTLFSNPLFCLPRFFFLLLLTKGSSSKKKNFHYHVLMLKT